MSVSSASLVAVTGEFLSKRVVLSVAAILLFPVLWWLVILGKFPLVLFCAVAGLSVAAFIMYGLDKLASKRGARRTPEKALQLCALLGGWPGALLAQQVFRHKSSKHSFQAVFWFMVALNCVGVGALLSSLGTAFIQPMWEMR